MTREAESASALKDAFSDGHSIARKDRKTAAFPLSHAFGVDSQNLVVTALAMAANADSVRRRDSCVTARHGDCLEEIDSTRVALWHFVTSRAVYLAEDGKPAPSITDERDVDSRVHQIITAVEFREAGGRLGEGQATEMD